MNEPASRPKIASAPLSVILIAHEAGPDLSLLVGEWKAILDARGGDFEILLIDDSTGAETRPQAEMLSPNEPRLRVIRHGMRMGIGAALRTGIAAANHPLLFYTTCDRQYRPEDLKLLLEQIDQVDVVSGCRSTRPMPWWLRVLGVLWRAFLLVVVGAKEDKRPCWLGWKEERRRWFARALFGLRLHDVNCAFRLIRREIFERIPVQSDGEFAQVEILAKANFLGGLMSEVPVRHVPPAGDTAKYCLAWKDRDVALVLSNPEFCRPAPPPEPVAPTPENPPGATPPSAK